MPAYSDSLCQSCDGLCSWPLPENAPTPSASLSLGRKSHRSSVESPCQSGPPSRWRSSVDRGRKEQWKVYDGILIYSYMLLKNINQLDDKLPQNSSSLFSGNLYLNIRNTVCIFSVPCRSSLP